MSKWLVTGASGYVGSRLMARSADFDAKLVPCSRRPLGPVGHHTGVLADLSQSPVPEIANADYSAIIHLAQSNNYRAFPQQAADIAAVNIAATAALVQQAVKAKVNAFIFASTANVYGSGPGLVTEECRAEPDSFYAATKLAAEHLLRQYSKLINLYILRIFTVYGPNQKGKLFDSIKTKILEGTPISIAGQGLALTPIFLDDLVNVIGECAEGSIRPGTYNVCGCEELNLEEISLAVGELCEEQPKFERSSGKALRYCGSNRKLLQSRPQKTFVPFREGVLSLVS